MGLFDGKTRLKDLAVVKFFIGAKGSEVEVTATPAELNALHSQGAVAADIAKLHALTASAVELNNAAIGVASVASHDYAGAAVAWTLSAAEQRATRLIVTNANGAVQAIVPAVAGKVLIVLNTSGQALTVKPAAQTGIVIASTKSAILIGNGTDFIRVTADA
jgi:hypothetical protein